MPVPDFRRDTNYSPRWSVRSRPDMSAPRRYARRLSKLTPDQEAAIRTLEGTRSLRSLAADYGVSHETIRTIQRSFRG